MSKRAWLAETRQGALKAFAGLPLPDRVAHAWRYTDPVAFLPAAGQEERESPGLYVLSPVPAGVELDDLEAAAEEGSDAVRPHLGRALGPEEGKLEALNMARWRKGWLVRARAGEKARDHLHLAVASPPADFCALRLLVIVEAEAALSLAVDFSGKGARGGSLNVALEIFVRAGGRFSFFGLQQLPLDASFYIAQRAVVGNEAGFDSVMVSLGGGIAKASLGAVLEGRGATSSFRGVTVGSGRQHFDHRTVLEHRGERGKSDFNYRTVLMDGARSAYTGLIRISPEAGECDAYQENRNLMLSDAARADTIPELEIMNNDVRCAHGATTGGPDPEQLFYLMSRGLDLPGATRAVAEGFVDPVGSAIPGPYRERLSASIAGRMGGR